MSSLSCPCGQRIFDNTDYTPWKAHVLPDMQWEELTMIVEAGNAPHGGAAVRSLFREAFECNACGRLHVMDRAGVFHSYSPDTHAPGFEILRGGPPKS